VQEAKAGDLLVGKFNFYKSPTEKDKRIPGLYFSYLVPPKASAPSESKAEEETSFEVMLLEQKVALLQKLMSDKKRKEEFSTLLNEVLANNPRYLPALDVNLRNLETAEQKSNEEISAAANKVIENIDITGVFSVFP
jgi:hypothetical protein